MAKYLIVNPHEEHRAAAAEALPARSRIHYAWTFEVASLCLYNNHYDGVFIDCYFPAGGPLAGRSDLGQLVIEKMVEPTDPRTKSIDGFIRRMHEVLPSDPETDVLLRRYGWLYTEENTPPAQWPLSVVADETRGLEGSPDVLIGLLRNTVGHGYRSPPEQICDNMKEHPDREPLGLIMAERRFIKVSIVTTPK